MRRFPVERRIIARSVRPSQRSLRSLVLKTYIQYVSPASTEPPKVATKTVIVADDTAFVRDRFKTVLEAAGHRTITVSSGNELVARVKADLAKIDLIVVDLRLPQANGVRLVRALRNIDPQK